MTASSLRSLLRNRTSPLHRQLDTRIGSFGTADDYRRYLRGTWLFRSEVEAALSAHAAWQPLRLADLAREDLSDLGIPLPAWEMPTVSFTSAAQALGACYVLEGSAVGARMLVIAARALGYSARCGARHLHAQAQDRRRWPAFIDLLDATAPEAAAEAVIGAETAFRMALASYPDHERV